VFLPGALTLKFTWGGADGPEHPMGNSAVLITVQSMPFPAEGVGDSNEAKSSVRSLDRALPRRDITVPIGTAIASAIS
jgi:hypothetical protein